MKSQNDMLKTRANIYQWGIKMDFCSPLQDICPWFNQKITSL